MKKRLAIISTHPIQYYAPWFQLLAERATIDVKVFYTWSQSKAIVKDKVFGKDIKWDIPLLTGYEFEFVDNVAKKPGSHHFFGIDCPSLITDIENYKPDVILIFGWNFKAHLKVLRHFRSKRTIWFRGDSTLLDETKSLKTLLRRLFLKWVYRHVDKALYVGEANKTYFIKHGLKNDQLIYAPHAIDNARFKGVKEDDYENLAEKWREELGFTSEDIVVLFAGKFEPKKQPDFLLEAFERANLSDRFKLLFVGNGILEDQLKSVQNAHIHFLPFQNQSKMPLVYRLGDILCLPSRGPGETWGLAVNEAMACGRSVIVSNKVGCAQDLVIHQKNGFVFNFKKVEDLSNILVNLEKNQLKAMGLLAQQSIESYSFQKIVWAIEEQLK